MCPFVCSSKLEHQDTPSFYAVQIPVSEDNMGDAFKPIQPPIKASPESKLKVVQMLTDENELILDQFFKKLCNGEIDGVPKLKNTILPNAFDRGTIYDYCYLPETNEWKNWMDFTNKEEIDQFPKGSVPQELIVTTVDTIRYGYM